MASIGELLGNVGTSEKALANAKYELVHELGRFVGSKVRVTGLPSAQVLSRDEGIDGEIKRVCMPYSKCPDSLLAAERLELDAVLLAVDAEQIEVTTTDDDPFNPSTACAYLIELIDLERLELLVLAEQTA